MNKNKVPDDCIPPKNYKQIIDKNRVDKFVNIKDVDQENDEVASQDSGEKQEDENQSPKDRRKQMTIVKKINNKLEQEKIQNRLLKDV